jgi:hypothetical protein
MTEYINTGNNIWCPLNNPNLHCQVGQPLQTQVGQVPYDNHITGPQVVGYGSGILILFLIGYFIPALIASSRDHRQKLAIFMLNLFFGWTFLGWVIALIWSCTADTKQKWESNRKSIWRD